MRDAVAPSIRIATTNPGKVREFQHLFDTRCQNEVKVLQTDKADVPYVEETGNSFVENARLKAKAWHQHFGGWVIADDSGLCVQALQGAPGIYSARYQNQAVSGLSQDAANRQKLLQALTEIQAAERSAYFVATLILIDPHAQMTEAEGKWHGFISNQEVGEQGFGYDPIFIPGEHFEGPTAAELSKAQKSAISHRAKAFEALMQKTGWL